MTKKGEIAKKTNEISTEITAEDIKKYFCPAATEKEVGFALQICKTNGLNPFKREAYIVKYGGNPAEVLTGYETYLKRAERARTYGGFKVWTEGNGPEMKACIEVYRKDWNNPLYHEVEYKEYVQYKKDRNGQVRPNAIWAKKPKTMLKKVAISQAFRFAWPDEFAGLPYIREEYNPEENEPQEVKDLTPKRKSEQSETKKDNPDKEQPEPAEPKKPQPEQNGNGKKKEILRTLKDLKVELGDDDFYAILEDNGVDNVAKMSLEKAEEIIPKMRKIVHPKETQTQDGEYIDEAI